MDWYLLKFHSPKPAHCIWSNPFGWIKSKLTRGRIMFQTVSCNCNSNQVHTHHKLISNWENLLSLLLICMLIDIATLIVSSRGSILTNERRTKTSWLFVLRCVMFLPIFVFSVFIFVWSIDKGMFRNHRTLECILIQFIGLYSIVNRWIQLTPFNGYLWINAKELLLYSALDWNRPHIF